MIKFSFIIPVYKVEKYLNQCVQSVLTQTYKDYEIILVDDGSPDKCPLLCDDWAKVDERVSVIHKKNGGLSSARNEGLKVAHGDYVIFLDSDDWWCDNTALERIASKIGSSNADVVFIHFKKYYTLKNEYSEAPSVHSELAKLDSIPMETILHTALFGACAWDKVVRRSFLVNNFIDFTIGQLSEDIEWCCKLLSFDLKYACVDGCVYVYRQQNASSIGSNVTNKNLSDIYEVIKKYTDYAKRTNNTAILNFLAIELVLWMAITDKATGKEGKRLIKDMSKYFDLLKYNLYPRTAKVAKVRFLGYGIVRRLLVWYLNHK